MTPKAANGWAVALILAGSIAIGIGFSRPARVIAQQAQQPEPVPNEEVEDGGLQRVLDTLHYLASLIPSFRNPERQVIGYAAIGEALAVVDRDEARRVFLQAFRALEKLRQSDEKETGSSDPRAAKRREKRRRELRNELFRTIQRVNPALARQLADRERARPDQGADVKSNRRRPITDRQRATQMVIEALQLLDRDPVAAVQLANQSLAVGISPLLSRFLSRLRQRDPALAEQLFQAAFLTALEENPLRFDDLLPLISYALPLVNRVGDRARSDPARARQLLGALLAALANDPRLENPGENQWIYARAARQFIIIQRLLPLYQRYAPDLIDDLHELMDRVSATLPSKYQSKLSSPTSQRDPVEALVEQAERTTDTRLRDELYAQAAIMAAQAGNMGRARLLIDRIHGAEARQKAKQQVALAGAEAALDAEDWTGFHALVGAVKDPFRRAALLIRAADHARSKDQSAWALAFLGEAEKVLKPLEPSEQKVTHLFDLVAVMIDAEPARAFDVAQAAAGTLNKLQKRSQRDRPPVENGAPMTPRSIRRRLTATFGRLAEIDFERSLFVATQLQNVEQRIVAQAAICRQMLLGHTRSGNTDQQ